MLPSLHRLSPLVLAAIVTSQSPALPAQSEWTGSGPAYTWTAKGSVVEAAGATVEISRVPPGSAADVSSAGGNVGARVPAESLRGRRVTLKGDVQTRGAAGSASLWLRVDGPAGMLLLDNGLDRAIRGDADWTAFSVTLPVVSSATRLVFGVILQGGGSVSVRSLRLEAGPAMSADAPVAPDARAVLDAAIGHVRKSAWMRESVDWAVVEPEVRLLASGATKSADVYPAIRYLLAALNDRHSFLMPPAANKEFQTGAIKNPPVEVRPLGERIGYVSVPGYAGGEASAMQAYTKQVHENLIATAGEAGCGWIVDLRNNTGGNMWPMLAGLKPFLGNEPLGTFISRESTTPPWKAGQIVGVEPPDSLRVLEQAWVAVLTGPRTASSGEAVTISFKGRPRTRSFGQPTYGLSSANSTFQLPDGAAILLTTAIESDRTGKRYGEKVDPDEVIADETALAAASAWLKRSCQTN